MTPLEQALETAYHSEGKQADANKVYLQLFKTTLLMPIENNPDKDKNPKALFLEENGQQFLPIFSKHDYFKQWAQDSSDDIDLLLIPGPHLLRGLGPHVFLCLDLGQKHYKQFAPDEIARLQSIIAKLLPTQQSKSDEITILDKRKDPLSH